jgi:hypothetical protein
MRVPLKCISAVALSVSLHAVLPMESSATPISWGFQGAVSSSSVGDIPVGTPVNVTWSFDTAQPNACAGVGGPDQGIYFGQTVTLDLGGLTYVTNGIFTNHANVASGCFGPSLPGTELRLINWSGPSLPGLSLISFWPCCASPAIAGIPATADGSLPSTPPSNIFIQGPIFSGPGGVASITSTAQVAPEPSTVTLVGAALLWRLRQRRRSMLTRQ